MGIFDRLFREKNSVDRYVGGDKPSQKKIRQSIERVFKSQPIGELLRQYERPKTPEEFEVIALVNRETDRLREKYGLPAYDIPATNFHIVRKDTPLLQQHNLSGLFQLHIQAAVVREFANRNAMAAVLLHETVHFKSFASVDVEDRKQRRGGLSTRDGVRVLFAPLDEAVTEELTRRFMQSQKQNPLFMNEMDTLDSFHEAFGHPGFEDLQAIFLQEEGGDNDVEIDPNLGIALRSFGYQKERQALQLLVKKIAEKHPERFENQEQAFDLFAAAMFNGYLLELARVIEGAFGKGKFRELGEQETGDDLLKFVESL